MRTWVEVTRERRVLLARLGSRDVRRARAATVSHARIDRRKRFDERALAAAVLADKERDAGRHVEARSRMIWATAGIVYGQPVVSGG